MRKPKHEIQGAGCAGACCLRVGRLGVDMGGADILRDVSFHLH